MTTIPEGVAQDGAQKSAAELAREALAAAKEASTYVSLHGEGHDPEKPLTAIRDAQVASGQATLAVAAEIATTRGEIRQVAEAVRELTATLSSVLGELGARVTDAERILSEDLGELRSELTTEASELCTEVAEARAAGVAELRAISEALTVLVDRPRWWQWRRRGEGDR